MRSRTLSGPYSTITSTETVLEFVVVVVVEEEEEAAAADDDEGTLIQSR